MQNICFARIALVKHRNTPLSGRQREASATGNWQQVGGNERKTV